MFGDQWHLQNTGQVDGAVAGNDINVVGVWNTYTGAGVNIAITSTGVEVAHPDLSANARTDIDVDIVGGDDDPTPVAEPQGTSAAGIAAARGNNSVGVSGVAYEAGIVGIRLTEGTPNDQQIADALEHQLTPANASDRVDINCNPWGPADSGDDLDPYGPLTEAALYNGVANGRGGLGMIYVWRAGDARATDDNVNYDALAADKYTIAVGATGGDGDFAYYSEPGAAMLVNAPSSYDTGSAIVGTTTTTLTANGSYISNFDKTASASATVAGVIALMLEANPNLGWRDVQHILVETSTKTMLGPTNWITNATGRLFSHRFGFGRVDANAAVSAALDWGNVPAETSVEASESVSVAIPDDDTAGVTRTLPMSFPANFVTEHVELELNVAHTYRGDLRVALTSPGGTVSLMALTRQSDSHDNYSGWKFTSVADWGEDPNGTWTLNVSDRNAVDTGTLNGWTVTVWGYSKDTANVWADAQYSGVEMGDQGRPFNTFAEAMNLVDASGTVHLKASNFNEPGTYSKAVRLESVGGTTRLGL
jgi:subtilisin-like proprotein convertase family protein